MAFLKYELQNYAIIDAKVKVSDFMKQNNITKNHMIFKMSFDKKVFKTEQEVQEYCKNIFYYFDVDIDEQDDAFVYQAINMSQADESTKATVELRRGLTVDAYEIRTVPYADDINYFNEKGVTGVYLGYALKELKLNDKDEETPTVIELARVVSGEHGTHGKVEITKEHLKSFQKNFNDKVTGVDIAVNEDHKKEEAFGWILEVFLSEDDKILYGKIKWNKKGITALSEKEYRYFSPELNFSYVHPHTKKEYGATLVGGALTNYPFLKMGAIVSLSDKTKRGNNAVTKPKEDIMPEEIELQLKEQNNKITELSEKLSSAVKTATDLSNKVSELEKEKEKMKEDQEYKELFDKNLINAAQYAALKEGKSAKEVLMLSEKINAVAKGENNTKEVISLNDTEEALITKLGLTKEEYVEFNK